MAFKIIGKYCKDCLVFNDEVEDEAINTIYDICNKKEFADSKVRIMPDVHQGKGIVIGFTAPLIDSVCPSHVGVDIGCTIDTWITDVPIDSSKFPLIEHRVKKEIPFGFNINTKREYEMKEFIKFLKSYYNKAKSSWSEMIEDIDISENYLSSMLKRISMDEGTFYKSIGSVGGGEMDCHRIG